MQPVKTRSYHAASNPQFLASWLATDTDANSEVRPNLRRLRNLSRSLERDNPYCKRFLAEWETNVVGPNGFAFTSKAADGEQPDEMARRIIEEAFKEWKRAENCTVTGDMPYAEFKRMSERAVVRDGNVIVRIIRGFKDSAHRFAIQLLEGDYIDTEMNRKLSDGSKIVMGKELNRYGRAVAYHMFGEHPGEAYSYNGKRYTRIPAKDVIHRFYRDRPGQVMGVPLITASITGLRHIERYEEAEQIAARISASSTVSVERDFQAGYDGGDDAESEFDFDLEPGGVWNLPYGHKANLINPTHPNANYEQFRKGVLRGVASGMLANYNIIGSDFEGVTYSSLREGKLNQQALVSGFRQLNIDREEIPIFEAWLETVLAFDLIGLPLGKLWKFRKAEWHGRGWDWVDPLKDSKGVLNDLEMGVTSLTREIAKRGGSLEQILAEREAEKRKFENLGLALPAWMNAAASPEIDPALMADEQVPNKAAN